jgi:hypothetical protein
MVHALFKGGDAFEFNNYMGIIIGPILAKLFAMIFNKRLSEWAKQHGLHAKGQVGFRKNYLTIDQLFILWTLIEESKAKKETTLLLFCELDIVLHEVLWEVLASLGVEGHFLRCLQVMYAKDTIRINHPSEGFTSSFKCQQGVK